MLHIQVPALRSFWYTLSRAVVIAVLRPSGDKPLGPLPTKKVSWVMDYPQPILKGYRRVTAFDKESADVPMDQIDLCFPFTFTISMAATNLVVHPNFPVSPLGLVHVRQTITQHCKLPESPSKDYVLTIFFHKNYQKELGWYLELKLLMTLGDKLVWEGVNTFLSRGKGKKKKRGARPPPPVWQHNSKHVVPENTGRRYAAVSGDYNLHHLHKILALPFGFSRPIAQGMWTAAAAVRKVQQLGLYPKGYPLCLELDWKRPLSMPSKVTFGCSSSEGVTSFAVANEKSGAPHVVGKLYVGSAKD